MNYYIIPKNNLKLELFLLKTPEETHPILSYSLIYYLNEIYTNLLKLEETDNITIEYINKIVNPFEFIHTNVPGTLLSVSKVKAESIFFELFEIFQICNLFNLSSSKSKMNIAHLTHNYASTSYLLNLLREDMEDIIYLDDFNFYDLCDKFVANEFPIKIDFFIFEFKNYDFTNTKQYINNILLTLFIITKYQNNNGTSIIKLDGIFYKIIIDVIFIFSSIYEKVFLTKPSISNITNGERYIICKNINYNAINNSNLLSQLESQLKPYLLDVCHCAVKPQEPNNTVLNLVSDTNAKYNLHSLLKNEIPCFFLNKIEESNVIIGQQQLESFDQIINIFKNKNKTDKIETLKRNNIQKCVQWCEKYQIPHNKFMDKINIFLSSKKKDFIE